MASVSDRVSEAVPPGLQLGPDRAEVVDLTVQDHGLGSILIEDRLVPRGEIDDAQPAVPERGLPPHVDALRRRGRDEP